MQLRLELLDKRWEGIKAKRDADPVRQARKMPDFAAEVDEVMKLERLQLIDALNTAREDAVASSS